MTAGIGYSFGPVNTSLTYAYIWDSNNDFEEQAGYKKPGNLVLSADYAIAPGLVLAGDLASFDMDQTNAGKAVTGEGDKGWAGVASVRLSVLIYNDSPFGDWCGGAWPRRICFCSASICACSSTGRIWGRRHLEVFVCAVLAGLANHPTGSIGGQFCAYT